MSLLEIKDIKKEFPKVGGILNGVSLEVERGEVVVILGPSGCGKSTLLRCINGLEEIQQGEILLDGEIISNRKKNMHLIRQKIGMVFQSYDLFPHLTVEKNILLGPVKAQGRNPDEVKKEAVVWLERVGLIEKKDSYPRELSGGQKQRVGIARALTLNPEILLCDEATSALDPRTTDSILELLQRINKDLNVTIIMITHQMNVIQKVCNKVAVLEKGELVESGNVIDVFGNPQKETTRGFIRTVINDQLPESVKTYLRDYDKPQKVVRLRFDGKNADNPIMSLAIKETGVNISILYGTVTELEGKVVGFQTVQITGEEKQLTAAETFFKEHNVPAVEVKL